MTPTNVILVVLAAGAAALAISTTPWAWAGCVLSLLAIATGRAETGQSETAVALDDAPIVAISPDEVEQGERSVHRPDESESPEEPLKPEALLATMSHEIRTPLNGTLGMIELLLRTPLSAEQRSIAQAVWDSGQILSQVVDDYLAFYRIEAGEIPNIHATPTDPEESLLGILLLLQGLASEKDLDLVFDQHSELPALVSIDRRRLHQVVSNLALNAIKYTESGEVVVSASYEDGHLVVEVNDTGPGMTDDQVTQLFVPFRRLETGVSQTGSGLGLAISQKIVEQLEGTIEIDSSVGVGTSITVRFPARELKSRNEFEPYEIEAVVVGTEPSTTFTLAEYLERIGASVRIIDRENVPIPDAGIVFLCADPLDEGARIELARKVAIVDVLWMSDTRTYLGEVDHVLIRPFSISTVADAVEAVVSGKPRASTMDRWSDTFAGFHALNIVVGEDDPTSWRVIQEMLAQLGYEVSRGADGPSTLELVEKTDPDVVIIDLNMPGFGGTEVVRRSTRSPWWIATTASIDSESRAECRDLGVRELLRKPISMESLRAALVRAIQRSSFLSLEDASADVGLDSIRDLFEDAPDAYVELLRTQIAQSDLFCADIIAGVNSQTDSARLAAHTLRSSAASLGCAETARHAERLDLEWNELDLDERQILAARIQEAWEDGERPVLVAEMDRVKESGAVRA